LEGQNVLEDLREKTSVPAEAAVTQDPGRDRGREARVLATLRGNHLARASRHRQGVVYARAMFVEEAREVAAELRRSVMRGEVLASLECLGSIVGLNPTVAPDVNFGTACREDGPAFCLDLDEGCAGYDLNRVLERAQNSTGASCHPATRIVLVPLPDFLTGELRRRRERTPSATHLGDLTGWPEWEGRTGVMPAPGYRLKPTLTRFRRSLGPILLDADVAPIVASAALLDFRLGTKSNHSYVVYSQSMVDEALDHLYETLGWD
jgi:hypothetical protein